MQCFCLRLNNSLIKISDLANNYNPSKARILEYDLMNKETMSIELLIVLFMTLSKSIMHIKNIDKK